MWYNAWDSVGDLNKLILNNYRIKIYRSEPKRKIMKLTTDQGVKALKIINLSYSRYTFVCEAIEHARQNGYVNIPRVVHTNDNKLGIQTKTGLITMIDWVDAKEANYDNDLDLQLSTKALAQLHIASHGFKSSKKASEKNLWGKWIENLNYKCIQMLEFKKMAQNKKEKSSFDNKYIEYMDYYYDLSRKSIQLLEESDYYKISKKNKRQSTFCHHDLGSANVLLTKNNLVYFIDFDNCILDMTIHDLASFILKNIQYKKLDMNKVDFILKIYHKENPVSEDEIKLMKGLMTFPQEFYDFGVRYYLRAKKYSWSEEKFDIKLSNVINDIPMMEAFMKNF